MVTVKATMEDIQDGLNGGCISCGEIQYGGCEPDAREYKCESCGERKVYGLEELIIMGMIDLDMPENEDIDGGCCRCLNPTCTGSCH